MEEGQLHPPWAPDRTFCLTGLLSECVMDVGDFAGGDWARPPCHMQVESPVEAVEFSSYLARKAH